MANDIHANDIHTGQEPRLSEIVSGIVSDAEELVKQQLALFKTEIRDDVHKTKEAALPLVVGALIGGLGIVLLAFGIVYLLAWGVPAVPLWAWFLIVGVVLAGGGVALAWEGKTRFEALHLPDKSATALKENVQWLMNPK
jgi:uncharacterized membrane protein YqjE